MTGMKKDERSREFTSLPNINTWLNVQQFWNKSQFFNTTMKKKNKFLVVFGGVQINVEVESCFYFIKKILLFLQIFNALLILESV